MDIRGVFFFHTEDSNGIHEPVSRLLTLPHSAPNFFSSSSREARSPRLFSVANDKFCCVCSGSALRAAIYFRAELAHAWEVPRN